MLKGPTCRATCYFRCVSALAGCGLLHTEDVAWSVGLSVDLSICQSRPCTMQKRLNRSRCRLSCGLEWNHVLDGGADPHTWMVNFEGEMGPSQDMPGHVHQSIYSKRLSRGQHRYGADADLGVLNSCAYWCNLANTIEQSVCGGDAALRSNVCWLFKLQLQMKSYKHFSECCWRFCVYRCAICKSLLLKYCSAVAARITYQVSYCSTGFQ